jgi:hypothetical protein
MGDWGLGIGKSPIPNPQSKLKYFLIFKTAQISQNHSYK